MNLSGETFKTQNGRDFPWRLEKKKKRYSAWFEDTRTSEE